MQKAKAMYYYETVEEMKAFVDAALIEAGVQEGQEIEIQDYSPISGYYWTKRRFSWKHAMFGDHYPRAWKDLGHGSSEHRYFYHNRITIRVNGQIFKIFKTSDNV